MIVNNSEFWRCTYCRRMCSQSICIDSKEGCKKFLCFYDTHGDSGQTEFEKNVLKSLPAKPFSLIRFKRVGDRNMRVCERISIVNSNVSGTITLNNDDGTLLIRNSYAENIVLHGDSHIIKSKLFMNISVDRSTINNCVTTQSKFIKSMSHNSTVNNSELILCRVDRAVIENVILTNLRVEEAQVLPGKCNHIYWAGRKKLVLSSTEIRADYPYQVTESNMGEAFKDYSIFESNKLIIVKGKS